MIFNYLIDTTINIFSRLFFSRLFGFGSKDKRNYKDKTPYKVQIMRNALVRREVEFGNRVYSVHVPARLVKNYQAALVKKAKKAVLTPLEKDLSYWLS